MATDLEAAKGAIAKTDSVSSTSTLNIKDFPYLERLRKLERAYPALRSFLDKITNNKDFGRHFVEKHYAPDPCPGEPQRPAGERILPGRCAVLTFSKDEVNHVETFKTKAGLEKYLNENPTRDYTTDERRRLFILEDMDPAFVDLLGHHLGVDPLVFSEQMNTWNFTDSRSIPHRALPSLHSPTQSYTLRYYEIRSLTNPRSIDVLRVSMTFASNRRKYERWRDIDSDSIPVDRRHAFVRRCASFWTSQRELHQGWDALLLVDPGFNAARHPESNLPLILSDPKVYPNRKALWKSEVWNAHNSVEPTAHESHPYHDGCPTLAPLLFPNASRQAQDDMAVFQEQRDLASPLDELVFYWTKIATEDLREKACLDSQNSAYYLLKYVAQSWTNQLELICCGVAQSEYFADDHSANINADASKARWKKDLAEVTKTTKDINYMRRQMAHFERAMTLNLERLGIQLGCEQIDDKLPLALSDAQRDFLTINARLQPFRQRVDDLVGLANELASLRAAFKSIQDSELSVRLSLFAAIVFPITLVASILSMGERFAPGASQFWIFWATSVPLVLLFAVLLVYGRRPYHFFMDMREYQELEVHRTPNQKKTQ